MTWQYIVALLTICLFLLFGVLRTYSQSQLKSVDLLIENIEEVVAFIFTHGHGSHAIFTAAKKYDVLITRNLVSFSRKTMESAYSADIEIQFKQIVSFDDIKSELSKVPSAIVENWIVNDSCAKFTLQGPSAQFGRIYRDVAIAILRFCNQDDLTQKVRVDIGGMIAPEYIFKRRKTLEEKHDRNMIEEKLYNDLATLEKKQIQTYRKILSQQKK